MKFAIALHGGAGSDPRSCSAESNRQRKLAMAQALQVGIEFLKQGGSALSATEQVVKILEDDPQFNAGRGAVFNARGTHDLDAAIMDGRTLACGAVAGVSTVKNPIALARLVLSETRHVLLAGSGAEEFARSQGVPLVAPEYFDTEQARQSWELLLSEQSDSNLSDPGRAFVPNWDIGTVGCVAQDGEGNLAAATSTGGITHKQFGRIGDSPLIGCGTYADNLTCAVSGTGIGEQFVRFTVAYDIAAQLKYRGVSLAEAVADNLFRRLNRGDGGVIAIDRTGQIVMEFSTPGMARAAADSNGRFEVRWDD